VLLHAVDPLIVLIGAAPLRSESRGIAMNFDRRTMLSGLATAGLWRSTETLARAESGTARRVLRLAFLTDSHLPGSPAENQRISKMLDQVQGQRDKRELASGSAPGRTGFTRSHPVRYWLPGVEGGAFRWQISLAERLDGL
jgi:hypothetical protein